MADYLSLDSLLALDYNEINMIKLSFIILIQYCLYQISITDSIYYKILLLFTSFSNVLVTFSCPYQTAIPQRKNFI